MDFINLQHAIITINPNLSVEEVSWYAFLIKAEAVEADLDPILVAAVIATESQFNRLAIGSCGELGLMQLRPEFHLTQVQDLNRRHKKLLAVETNIHVGVNYLKALKVLFEPRYGAHWVEFYNRGPYGKVPKTFRYSKRVNRFYRQIASGA